MTDEPMTLIEQLRNPAWVHGDHGFESPQLEIDMTRVCMDQAANMIDGLQAQVSGLKQLSEVQSKITTEREATISRLTAERDHTETMMVSFAAEAGRLRKALEQCAARFATPPGTVSQCQQAIAVEFQRRMDIAGNALATPTESDAVRGGGK